MARLKVLLILSLLFSCSATIPPQSVILMDAITREGKQMHQINVDLLNKMFEKKRTDIDAFIKNEYTPAFIQNFQNKIPPGTDMVRELPTIIQTITPIINARRDSMQTALENQRVRLLTKLEQDFRDYSYASEKLRELLVSAVKVDSEKQKLYEQVNKLSGDQINFNKIENAIDRFILDKGSVGQNVLKLNESMNEITN